MGVEIRKWNPAVDNVAEITQVLHRAYAELASMGFRYVATWQDDAVTLARLERGVAFLAKIDTRVVGTATLYFHTPARCAWYEQDNVAYFGQFGIDPDFQRQGVGTRLMNAIEAEAIQQGYSNLALDTAREARHLVSLYERLGFQFIQEVDWEQTNYTSIIMNKKLRIDP